MKAVVTGGTGFLGSALVHSLVRDGYSVVSLARSKNHRFESLGIAQKSVDFSELDRAHNLENLRAALSGADIVFHVAAKVAMWGKWKDFYSTNVQGTKIILAESRAARVRCFVYTSSPSVVASGEDLSGVDETAPYPDHFEAHYPHTKALAEQSVLAAHDEELRTIALRPHLIFGPGDTNLVPTIIRKARAGRLAVLGKGFNRVDFSYIDDCVAAHRCAAKALAATPSVGGKPYFISQGEPIILWDFINRILAGIQEPIVTRRLPYKFAAVAAGIMELAATLTGREPSLTRFLVSEMATEHFFNISNARNQLGYDPQTSMATGIENTVRWLKDVWLKA